MGPDAMNDMEYIAYLEDEQYRLIGKCKVLQQELRCARDELEAVEEFAASRQALDDFQTRHHVRHDGVHSAQHCAVDGGRLHRLFVRIGERSILSR